MDEIKRILNRIQKLRQKLNMLVESSNDRTAEEILKASKMLDTALNDYDMEMKKK